MDGDETQLSTNLAENFDQALKYHQDLEDSDLSTNDDKYQEKVKKAINLLEKATEMVNKLELFSVNETIDDIPTKSLRYLLLPALLGYFSSKLQNKARKDIIQITDIYYKDFLKRVRSYEVCPVDYDLDDQDQETSGDGDSDKQVKIKSGEPDLEQMARDRDRKIQTYRAQKELQNQLETLQTIVNSSKEDVSDEKLREFYTLLIKRWVGLAIEELRSMIREKEILRQMERPVKRQENLSKKQPFKPFIITRSELQKQVYGLGYPSVPTVTIEEFINTKIIEGSLSETKPGQVNSLMEWAKNPDLKRQQEEEDDEQKEKEAEKEDHESLRKAREWDEFKDENKRGWGNRHNRS
ncbi:immunoglobulin binding protein Tap42 [Brevipalpus obovatus]|uniref:immunoglobulin binding protein Tap42 n=1 Tax=Brevipalpus obovatus TaxID=246614 RepID=UPI003D9F41BA